MTPTSHAMNSFTIYLMTKAQELQVFIDYTVESLLAESVVVSIVVKKKMRPAVTCHRRSFKHKV
jgi:hypothetical protein